MKSGEDEIVKNKIKNDGKGLFWCQMRVAVVQGPLKIERGLF